MTTQLSTDHINAWADDPTGPVALHLKQTLVPVEGKGGVVFPPSYADIGYNIDTLVDGTKVATIDSVGAQANRIEPIFKDPPYAELVPQIEIAYGNDKVLNIMDAGHRLGDAVIRSVGPDDDGFDLMNAARVAFEALLDRGDASQIAKLAPTSLVFGAWDSRETGAKVPRIVQSVIRAWDVSELHRSAQYNPALDYAALDIFSDAERKKQEGKAGSQLAKRGFVHVPATNSHGGIVVHGSIQRDVTVNLVALRRLAGDNDEMLRHYVLGLSLIAASAPLDPFLRQGCMVVPDPDYPGEWTLVERSGTRRPVGLGEETALAYASASARSFGVGQSRRAAFSKTRALEDAKRKSKD